MVDIAIHKPMAYIAFHRLMVDLASRKLMVDLAFRRLFEKRWIQSTGGAILQDRAKWVTFVV